MRILRVPPLLRRPLPPPRFRNRRVMKHAQQIRRQHQSATRRLPVETVPPSSHASPNWFLRLILGGAICGSFAGSFAGAFLGAAIGAVYRDISLGLDGALLGSAVAAPAGAVYGAFVAWRDKRKPVGMRTTTEGGAPLAFGQSGSSSPPGSPGEPAAPAVG